MSMRGRWWTVVAWCGLVVVAAASGAVAQDRAPARIGRASGAMVPVVVEPVADTLQRLESESAPAEDWLAAAHRLRAAMRPADARARP